MSEHVTHAPGPWRVDNGPASETWQIWRIDEPEWIADIWTSEADAHLIAAAPELFQALTWAVDALGRLTDRPGAVSTGTAFRYKVDECRAAIAKAEGHEL
jgi:hypothetical protein